MLFWGSLFFSNAQELTEKNPEFFGKKIAADKISSSGHIKCITDEYEQYLQEKNPKRLSNEKFEEWLAPLIEKYKNTSRITSYNVCYTKLLREFKTTRQAIYSHFKHLKELGRKPQFI